MYESVLVHCLNELWLAFGRAAAGSRYVWAPVGQYFVLSHIKVAAACDYLLSSPFEYI
jgi:hypothetical protein